MATMSAVTVCGVMVNVWVPPPEGILTPVRVSVHWFTWFPAQPVLSNKVNRTGISSVRLAPQPLFNRVTVPDRVTCPSFEQFTARLSACTSISGTFRVFGAEDAVLSVPSLSHMASAGSMVALNTQVQLAAVGVKLKVTSVLAPALRLTVWSANNKPQSDVRLTTTLLAAAQPVLPTFTVTLPWTLPSAMHETAGVTLLTVRSGMLINLSEQAVLSAPSLSQIVSL